MNYYNVLGVDRNASRSQISAQYRKLAMKYHPDRNPNKRNAVKRFKAITEAFEILSNPKKRSQYDSKCGLDDDVVIAEVVPTEQTSSMWHTSRKKAKWQKEYRDIFGDEDDLNDDRDDEERAEDDLRSNYYRNNLHKVIVLEEERLGKWIAGTCAVLLWLVIASVFVATRKPQGYFECDNGDLVPFSNSGQAIKAEDRTDWEIKIKKPH
jgi:DnaJ-class molecular chaperone